MKLHELSDQDANRWVATKLKPMPAKPAISGRFSKTDCWCGTEDGEWQPRDFVSDPAMWSMLLEQLVAIHFVVIGQTPACDKWGEHAHLSVPPQKLGRAVVEAWMLANGWNETTE